MRRASIIVFNVVLAGIFVVLGFRLWQMQILEGGIYRNQADANRIRIITSKADRGVIYDRNLLQLVSNRPVFAVAITPADLPGTHSTPISSGAVFTYLANLFHTAPVVTVIADDLPIDRQADVVNQLAGLLHVPASELLNAINTARQGPHAAYTLLRRDVDAAAAGQLRTLIGGGQLPGITVMDELEYNLYARQSQPYKPVIIKQDISYDQMRQVEEDHLKLPGVSVVDETVRQYPDGPIFAHLLGYVGPITPDQYAAALPPEGSGDLPTYDGDDTIGQTGIEASMEDILRGKKGAATVEVNSNQRIVNELNHQDPLPGKNIVLTIDSHLQYSVTQALQAGLNAANSTVGAAIVMKVNTGEILAMVSLPSYDNNLFANGISQADMDRLNNDPSNPLFDNTISGLFAPGSTFKMITAAAALQEKVVSPSDLLFCPSHIDVPTTWDENQRNIYRDWKVDGHGSINIVQALEESSDTFFYQAAGPRQQDELGKFTRFYVPGSNTPQYFNGLGITRLHAYMQDFGLGAPTGVDLPGESRGVAPDPAYKLQVDPQTGFWSLGDTLQSAIGQGFDLLTPLQLVNVTAAVANGGTLYKPQLVEQVLDSDGGTVIQDFKPQVLSLVPVSADNLALIRQGMRLAVHGPHGTATRTDLKDVAIAGKTGTAEFGEPLPGLNVRAANAWFVAFAPADTPEIALVVLIKGEAATLEGSTFAVPVAREILKDYFHVSN